MATAVNFVGSAYRSGSELLHVLARQLSDPRHRRSGNLELCRQNSAFCYRSAGTLTPVEDVSLDWLVVVVMSEPCRGGPRAGCRVSGWVLWRWWTRSGMTGSMKSTHANCGTTVTQTSPPILGSDHGNHYKTSVDLGIPKRASKMLADCFTITTLDHRSL